MKCKMTLVLYFLLFFILVAFGKKKSRTVLITGTVVDSLGFFIPNQKVALVNAMGNDKNIKYADAYGIFFYNVKRKNLKRFAVRVYSQYGLPKKVPLHEFIENNQIALQTYRYQVYHNFVKFIPRNLLISPEALDQLNRSIRCSVYVETSRYPFAFVNADYIRSYFTMVK